MAKRRTTGEDPVHVYQIPINGGVTKDGEEETITVEVVQLRGGRKKRRKGMKRFLKLKYNITGLEFDKVMKAMGFKDLL